MATIINGDGIVTAEGTSTTQGRVRLGEDTDNGTNYVELQAPASLASNLTFTLPSADGTNGQVLQTNGSGALSFVTPSSGLAAATQAQMEAATSNTVAATPLNTNWHPGVVKAWLKCNGAGTTINASYNITSITDTGTGIVTVTIATDFSSADYCISGSAQGSSSGAPGMKYIHISSQAAGSFVATSGADPSASGPSDPDSYYLACIGDQ